MDFITLTQKNIEEEHICCAFSDKKSSKGYAAKKEWLKEQIDKGYVFTKINERAKVFIEYCPSEVAYLPVHAPNYMVINCFWVSGKYKGNGYGKKLLEQCIQDSQKKGKDGVVVLCSNKKRPFMSDKKFFLKHGFQVVDKAEPYFELMALSLNEKGQKPNFMDSVKAGNCEFREGFTVYYSHQCPYMDYYINLQREVAEKHGVKYEAILVDNKEKAMYNPSPFTIYSLFYKGEFVTQELTAEKKFEKIINEFTNN